MSSHDDHLSLPRLYGAPPHVPRRLAAPVSERPLDPDDLPLETFRTPEEEALATALAPRAYSTQLLAPLMGAAGRHAQRPPSGGSPLLRALAGRLRRVDTD